MQRKNSMITSWSAKGVDTQQNACVVSKLVQEAERPTRHNSKKNKTAALMRIETLMRIEMTARALFGRRNEVKYTEPSSSKISLMKRQESSHTNPCKTSRVSNSAAYQPTLLWPVETLRLQSVSFQVMLFHNFNNNTFKQHANTTSTPKQAYHSVVRAVSSAWIVTWQALPAFASSVLMQSLRRHWIDTKINETQSVYIKWIWAHILLQDYYFRCFRCSGASVPVCQYAYGYTTQHEQW